MKTRWFELLQSPEPGSEGGAGTGGAGAGAGGADSAAGGSNENEGDGDDLSRVKHALQREREVNREKDRRMGALEAQLRELSTTNMPLPSIAPTLPPAPVMPATPPMAVGMT